MRRKALIIGNSGDKKNPNEYLEGVEKDIKNYKDFLLSPIGGLWNKEEISVSLNETKEQIRKELIALKQNKYDFVFILFSGHGSYSSFKQCRKLYIFDDFIYEEEIRNLSVLILDISNKAREISHNVIERIAKSNQVMDLTITKINKLQDEIKKIDKNVKFLYENVNLENIEENELNKTFSELEEMIFGTKEGLAGNINLISELNILFREIEKINDSLEKRG